MKKLMSSDKIQNRLIIIFLLAMFVVYAFISVMLHLKHQTFGWDLGYFDQLIWKVSQGLYPLSSLSKVNLLAGHFAPILFLLAPVYWIWSDAKSLLIFQAFIMVVAAYPLYLLAMKKSANFWFSAAVIFAYLLFIGTQWSILNEYHEATFAPFFISLIFYGLEKNRSLFWWGVLGLFGTKEEFSLLLAAIGLTVCWQFKRPKLGIALFLASIFMFFVLTEIFMPTISEKGVYQHLHLSDRVKSPAEFVKLALTDPVFILKSLVTPRQKLHTLFWSLWAFGFLPLLAPIGVFIPLLEQFLMRFLYTGPQFTVWQNVNHHAAPTAILLAISVIYALPRLTYFIQTKTKWNQQETYLVFAIWLLSFTIFQDIYFKAPLHSLFKKNFYMVETFVKDNQEMIQQIPDSATVAAQNSLIPHLSQRENFYLLPETGEAEYIAVDLHDGPNKYAPVSISEIVELVQEATRSGKYQIKSKINEAILLEKNI